MRIHVPKVAWALGFAQQEGNRRGGWGTWWVLVAGEDVGRSWRRAAAAGRPVVAARLGERTTERERAQLGLFDWACSRPNCFFLALAGLIATLITQQPTWNASPWAVYWAAAAEKPLQSCENTVERVRLV